MSVQQDACKYQNILPIPHFTMWHASKLLFDVDNNMSYDLNSSTTCRRSCLIDLAHGRHLILDSLTKRGQKALKVAFLQNCPMFPSPNRSNLMFHGFPFLNYFESVILHRSTPVAIVSDLIWFGEEVVVVDLWPLERGLILTWRATQTQNHARAISFPLKLHI